MINKILSLKSQTILLWIPYVNYVIPLIWLYRHKSRSRESILGFVKLFVVLGLVFITARFPATIWEFGKGVLISELFNYIWAIWLGTCLIGLQKTEYLAECSGRNRTIPVWVQWILLPIPIVNISLLFIRTYNYLHSQERYSKFLRTTFSPLFATLMALGVECVCTDVFPWFPGAEQHLHMLLSVYFIPLIAGLLFVISQMIDITKRGYVVAFYIFWLIACLGLIIMYQEIRIFFVLLVSFLCVYAVVTFVMAKIFAVEYFVQLNDLVVEWFKGDRRQEDGSGISKN